MIAPPAAAAVKDHEASAHPRQRFLSRQPLIGGKSAAQPMLLAARSTCSQHSPPVLPTWNPFDARRPTRNK